MRWQISLILFSLFIGSVFASAGEVSYTPNQDFRFSTTLYASTGLDFRTNLVAKDNGNDVDNLNPARTVCITHTITLEPSASANWHGPSTGAYIAYTDYPTGSEYTPPTPAPVFTPHSIYWMSATDFDALKLQVQSSKNANLNPEPIPLPNSGYDEPLNYRLVLGDGTVELKDGKGQSNIVCKGSLNTYEKTPGDVSLRAEQLVGTPAPTPAITTFAPNSLSLGDHTYHTDFKIDDCLGAVRKWSNDNSFQELLYRGKNPTGQMPYTKTGTDMKITVVNWAGPSLAASNINLPATGTGGSTITISFDLTNNGDMNATLDPDALIVFLKRENIL